MNHELIEKNASDIEELQAVKPFNFENLQLLPVTL